MAFSELVKSFEKIRGYMREFYVYGFRTRSGFAGKSGRTYDNERRRLECVLGEHTESSRDSRGKNVFLSIDSRSGERNPLYRLLRTCSFTDRDITLHLPEQRGRRRRPADDEMRAQLQPVRTAKPRRPAGGVRVCTSFDQGCMHAGSSFVSKSTWER